MKFAMPSIETAQQPEVRSQWNAMPLDVRHTLASSHLDVIRVAAAFAVLIFHVRYRFFLDYADVDSKSLLAKCFYVITSFGHDAVMVFFVLSGYLISGSILRDRQLGRFTWTRYGLNRLTRLYVVLIPGLLLTIFWDGLGLQLYPTNPVYTGAKTSWKQDYFDVRERLTPEVIAGNLLFMQTIVVPPLGSNAPLWSLAYEFWYYLLFPLIYVEIIHARNWKGRLASIATGLTVAVFVGKSIILYFPIWLMGGFLCVVPRCTALFRANMFKVALVMSAMLCAVAIFSGHLAAVKTYFGPSTIAADYATSIAFTMFLYVVMHDSRSESDNAYSRFARRAAGFSYTLYVVHIPLLIILRAALISGRPWEPRLLYILAAIPLTVVGLVYASVISSVSEARTAEVRSFVMDRLIALGVVT